MRQMIFKKLGAYMKRFRTIWALVSGVIVFGLPLLWSQKPKSPKEVAAAAPKPRADIPDAQWDGAKKDMQAQAYEAMGMAASLRKKYDESVTDYKQAIAVGATQDPATWLRLGQAYLDANKLDEASDAFDKALTASNATPQVKSIAQAKKDETTKRKAGAKAPGGSNL